MRHFSLVSCDIAQTYTHNFSSRFFLGGLRKFMDYQIDFVPDTLISIAERATRSYCYSLRWSNQSMLFSCGAEGLSTYDSDMEPVLKHKGHFTSFWSDQTLLHIVDIGGPVKDEMSILCDTGEMPSAQQIKPEVLCKFSYAKGQAPTITSYYNILVMTTATKSLAIYNKHTSEKTTKEFKYQPKAVCFNISGELLVVGDDRRLRKYKVDVESGQILNELWTCHGINNSYGICLMEKGLILVCSQSRLQIITQDG